MKSSTPQNICARTLQADLLRRAVHLGPLVDVCGRHSLSPRVAVHLHELGDVKPGLLEHLDLLERVDPVVLSAPHFVDRRVGAVTCTESAS